MANWMDDPILEIIGIAEQPGVPKLRRLEEGISFASRYVSANPHLVEFFKDNLLAAAISGRHAPDSEWLLSEIRLRLFAS
jgi:hypothetical protein